LHHCGRQYPSARLSAQGAPNRSGQGGDQRGEVCIAFNPGNVQVKQAQGRWKIADGNSWLLDFAGNRAEAQQAHAIINKYGFSRICQVGRPNPPMTYLRR
jgi:hypothetical protein